MNLFNLNIFVLMLVSESTVLLGARQRCSLPHIAHGQAKTRSKGRIISYKCHKGYTILGEPYGACIKGKWDPDPPVCLKPGCPPIKNFANGHMVPSMRWAMLEFSCNPGYKLVGPAFMYCNGRRWNTMQPYCKAAEVNCDFEGDTACNWYIETHEDDDFMWNIEQQEPPSRLLGTGPRSDHTHPSSDTGHYVMIETSDYGSSTHVLPARIHSPKFPIPSNNNTCFKFWYHMFGTSIGMLNVFLNNQKVFEESGNHGDRWIKGIIPLPQNGTDLQIIIEATHGGGHSGNIALDDFAISNGSDCHYSNARSCEGRCNEESDDTALCLCSPECYVDLSCCADYESICSTGTTYSTTGDLSETETESFEYMSTVTVEDVDSATIGDDSMKTSGSDQPEVYSDTTESSIYPTQSVASELAGSTPFTTVQYSKQPKSSFSTVAREIYFARNNTKSTIPKFQETISFNPTDSITNSTSIKTTNYNSWNKINVTAVSKAVGFARSTSTNLMEVTTMTAGATVRAVTTKSYLLNNLTSRITNLPKTTEKLSNDSGVQTRSNVTKPWSAIAVSSKITGTPYSNSKINYTTGYVKEKSRTSTMPTHFYPFSTKANATKLYANKITTVPMPTKQHKTSETTSTTTATMKSFNKTSQNTNHRFFITRKSQPSTVQSRIMKTTQKPSIIAGRNRTTKTTTIVPTKPTIKATTVTTTKPPAVITTHVPAIITTKAYKANETVVVTSTMSYLRTKEQRKTFKSETANPFNEILKSGGFLQNKARDEKVKNTSGLLESTTTIVAVSMRVPEPNAAGKKTVYSENNIFKTPFKWPSGNTTKEKYLAGTKEGSSILKNFILPTIFILLAACGGCLAAIFIRRRRRQRYVDHGEDQLLYASSEEMLDLHPPRRLR